jgi:hypothetical protein
MSFKIIINSLSRQSSSTSSSNFTVQLPTPFCIGDYSFIRLAYCLIPNTIYNITSTNNYIDFKVSGTNYSASISPGAYNANTLASALQTAMTSQLSNSWTITYNSNQFTYTIGGTTAFQLLFSSGTHASTSLWEILGYASSNGLSGIDTTSSTSTTSTQVVNFTLPLAVYINLTNICADQIFSSDGDTFSFVIPIDMEPGSVIEYDCLSNFSQYLKIPDNLNFINHFAVTLTSRNNQTVSLNGSEWFFVIEFCKNMDWQ